MTNPFVGKWSYRSFLNNPDLNVEFNALRFAAAPMELASSSFHQVRGKLIFDPDETEFMLLNGVCSFGNPFAVRMQGIGGSPQTQGWIYNYQGFLVPNWPDSVDQRPAIVGSVIRTVPHGADKPAGVVASFIAVRQD